MKGERFSECNFWKCFPTRCYFRKTCLGMSAVKKGACQPRQKQTIKHSATEHAKSCFLMKPPPARAPKINQFGHHRDYTNVTVSALLSEAGVTLSASRSDVMFCFKIFCFIWLWFITIFSSRGENYFGIFMMEMNNSNMISRRHTNSSSAWIIGHTEILNITDF